MVGISKLYCGTVEPSDALRYGRKAGSLPGHLLQFSADKKPVVVWNCTRACNLACMHCYAHAGCERAPDELSHEQGRALIDDLAAFGAPVLLFSGGEPLRRPDMPDLAEYAVAKGMRAVLSTNGTLITDRLAQRLKRIGLSYAGISLDGLKQTNDEFRGQPGAFEQALAGIRACQRAGLKVGLRFTMSRRNVGDLPGIFDLLESMGIPRICLYHMVYSGRAAEMAAEDLSHAQTREMLDWIIDRTADLHTSGRGTEVLTVDNHCDGPYVYLRLLREGRCEDAERVRQLLEMSGGNSSGHGIGCISWEGTVYPDQFLRHKPLGNVRDTLFSQIWSNPADPVLASMRTKQLHVTGKCKACRFLPLCGGNFRARALAATGNFWGLDPACYLTDQEIGL